MSSYCSSSVFGLVAWFGGDFGEDLVPSDLKRSVGDFFVTAGACSDLTIGLEEKNLERSAFLASPGSSFSFFVSFLDCPWCCCCCCFFFWGLSSSTSSSSSVFPSKYGTSFPLRVLLASFSEPSGLNCLEAPLSIFTGSSGLDCDTFDLFLARLKTHKTKQILSQGPDSSKMSSQMPPPKKGFYTYTISWKSSSSTNKREGKRQGWANS